MALKENIQAIKEEISTEEQFLENLIKGERFFKKYKLVIIGVIALAIVTSVGYSMNEYFKEKNLILTNKAYENLLKNPKDNDALETLKENKKLYLAYKFLQASKSKNTQELKNLLNSEIDPILKDIAQYDLNDDSSELYTNINYLVKGYELLKQNKIKEAKESFNQIPINSNLHQIVTKLNHYQGKI